MPEVQGTRTFIFSSLRNRTAFVERHGDAAAATIKLAQDLAATWQRARSERRKGLIAELFETVRVGGGRIVSVKPKPAVMPAAVTTTDKDWRSRPDSNRRSRP